MIKINSSHQVRRIQQFNFFLKLCGLICVLMLLGVRFTRAQNHNDGITNAPNQNDRLNGGNNNQIKVSVDSHYRDALEKQFRGDLAGALGDFNVVINFKPDWAEAYVNRGIVKNGLGDFTGAMADQTMAIKLDPTLAWAYYQRGFLRYNVQDFAHALTDFKIFCELNQKNQDIPRFRIWLIQTRAGFSASAALELQNYLTNRPAKSGADWALNIGHFLNGELSETNFFKSADALNPTQNDAHHSDAWFYAGSKRLTEDDIPTAIVDFAQCVAINAKDSQSCESAAAELKYLRPESSAQPTPQTEPIKEHPRTVKEALAQEQSESQNNVADRNERNAATTTFEETSLGANFYFQKATEEFEKGEVVPALADLNTVIRLNPDFAGAYLNRGITKADLADRDGAMADYDKAIELDPNSGEAYCNRGNLKAQTDNMAALADYNKALEINPASESALYNRGKLKSRMGDSSGALSDYNRAIEVHPRTIAASKGPFLIGAYIGRGWVKQSQRDFGGALADFDKAIELDPASVSAYYARSLAEKFQGNLQAALADNNKVVELRAAFTASFTNQSEMPKGGWESEMIDFNATTEVNRQTALNYIDRGRVKQMQGDLSGAMVDFSNAVALVQQPHDAIGYYHRGIAMSETGNFEGALADYAKALELDPYYHEVYRVRGMMKATRGDVEGAFADVNKAIELSPKYAEAYGSRGFLHYDLRDYAAALADFQQCCELKPKASQDSPRFRIWLIEASVGDKQLATKELQIYWQSRKATAPNDWGYNVFSFLTGDLTESDFLKSAENSDKRKNDIHHCEAWFYAGSKRLIEGDKTMAADYFTKCLTTKMKSLLEYQSAAAQLGYLQATK